LIPIRQTEWPAVHDQLLPGTEVIVRVHKINDYPKYRFPLQLELLAPEEAAPHIMAPDEYRVPANVGLLFEQGKDIKEVRGGARTECVCVCFFGGGAVVCWYLAVWGGATERGCACSRLGLWPAHKGVGPHVGLLFEQGKGIKEVRPRGPL
jgi:hypothetical protein